MFGFRGILLVIRFIVVKFNLGGVLEEGVVGVVLEDWFDFLVVVFDFEDWEDVDFMVIIRGLRFVVL